MATPRVSIGIPVYNGENFLGEAIRSIQAQTFQDFELVISDNASTDRTEEICRGFAAQDSRILYSRNEKNLGPGPNHNRAFLLSKGGYFQWVAHDDTFAPDYLEKCVAVLERDAGIVLCHTKTCFIDGHGKVIGQYDEEKKRTDSPRVHLRFRDLMLNVKCFEIFGVIRSSALRLTPLQGSFGHADGVLLARLGLMGRFHQIPEYLFFNRDHPEKSIYKYSTYRDYAVFYDPTNAGKILLPRWRMGYEYMKAVGTVPLGVMDRVRCSFQIVYWIRVYWKSLVANLAVAAWQVLRRWASFDGRKASRPLPQN